MIMILIFPQQSWVLKRELYKIPIFGQGLRILNTIAIDRSNNISVAQIIRHGTEKIKSGLWMIIFPEGTRLPVNKSIRLKPSGIKLAAINEVSIVPMVHNAGLFWPKGFWMIKPGKITIIIDKPIATSKDTDIRALTSNLEQWMIKEKNKLLA